MYGVEDFSVFLYALVRMHKPKVMLELGSGSGSCALLCAQAALENGFGKMLSVDDGRSWGRLRERPELADFGAAGCTSHAQFLEALRARFGLERHLEFRAATFPPFPDAGEPVELLFADYESHPAVLVALLAHYLPRMADSASLFIDGVPTYLPSYLLMERIVAQLNAGKLPRSLIAQGNSNAASLGALTQERRFTLVNFTEAKDRPQNSTVWLKIEPVDHVPYPLTTMR